MARPRLPWVPILTMEKATPYCTEGLHYYGGGISSPLVLLCYGTPCYALCIKHSRKCRVTWNELSAMVFQKS